MPFRTVTILGCGDLGTSILAGLMGCDDDSSLASTRYIAYVRSQESARRIQATIDPASTAASRLTTVYGGDALSAVGPADVVILACKPADAPALLQAPGVAATLRGKLIVSVLGGVPASRIVSTLDEAATDVCPHRGGSYAVLRAIPNVAARVHASTTIVEQRPGVCSRDNEAVLALFDRLGHVELVPEALMDPATALCASGPAFVALMLETMAQGATDMGFDAEAALRMATGAMRGTIALVLAGEDPARVRETVTTPNGATARGLAMLHERGAVISLQEALKGTAHAMRTKHVVTAEEAAGN
ncbi:hypothetical protein GTA08_BOTSDO08545 [Botryosphaeria dothidea]|uniref:Pyrroline-5-carboxylate reductase n=1 Tax=Botryosphaeria dothidea TaxID=55169 RepID=A0A8H4IN37_9PEZI|nr:hypothetical protein GTA08_BOTSDO08545 [Botryosphaeria dothidea]